MKLSKTQYDKIFSSAQNLIESAAFLASKGNFHHATSLLILSMEELMKYQIIMLLMVNKLPFEVMAFPQSGKSVFNDHPLKHNLAIQFQEACSSGNFNLTMHTLFNSNFILNQALPKLENPFAVWGFMFHFFGEDWIIPEKRMKEFLQLMNSANHTKNAGFYADIKNDRIISPTQINNKHYTQYLYFTNILFKQTAFMKSVDINNEEFEQWKNSPNETNEISNSIS